MGARNEQSAPDRPHADASLKFAGSGEHPTLPDSNSTARPISHQKRTGLDTRQTTDRQQSVEKAGSLNTEVDVLPLSDVHSSDRREAQTPRDLAFGMAAGLHHSEIAAFLASLRQHSDCDIVLIVRNLTNETSILFDKFRVSVLPYREDLASQHPSTSRWKIASEFLKVHQREYTRVLFADIRDTIFQSDPFAIIDRPGFFSALEKDAIKDCGWNTGWIKDCFSKEVLERVKPKRIVCSGVSLATVDSALQYLQAYDRIMATDLFRQCERNGVDQGIHNVIIHEEMVSNVTLFTQEDGPIAHLQNGIVKPKVDGVQFHVSNRKYSAIPIVHQYDRNLKLLHAIMTTFVTSGLHQQSVGTGKCAGYTLMSNLQGSLQPILQHGERDVIVADISGCCELCAALKHPQRCRSFSMHKGPARLRCTLFADPSPREGALARPFSITGWR